MVNEMKSYFNKPDRTVLGTNENLRESLYVEVIPLPVYAAVFNAELTFRIWEVTAYKWRKYRRRAGRTLADNVQHSAKQPNNLGNQQITPQRNVRGPSFLFF